jgi:hypothetical protein
LGWRAVGGALPYKGFVAARDPPVVVDLPGFSGVTD